ncbi:Testis-expressed sequence 13B protein [Myotis brandtii]|uniref:Testis-expressed sequence 13B protein n=1 Tax=Myotis brandtii TaxID=109478 RepID=S7PGB8_MYOBR|nr:PREDICTED: testis-expressed sequence 13B protein [Myotis brandtii]EPQ07137.1 Testis-expressed sequence 13B protein [Myotis brandtii]
MALRPEDPSAGFQHGNVVAFINEKMSRHIKGPEFYLENISLSWAEVEDKLRAILENSAVTSEAKEACAWGSLALGVRCARRQGQLHACRVQWLQDFTKLHKSALQALASNMKELTAKHEMECKEAAYQLQLTLAKLAEVQKEKELLRWKLLQAEMVSSWEWQQVSEEPGLATTSVFGAKGAEAPTPSPPWAAFTAGAPPQAAYWGPSMVGAQGTDPQEPQRDQRAFEPQQLRRPPASHRPGDWNCFWCNPVNFSGREICYHCGRGTWLQNP